MSAGLKMEATTAIFSEGVQNGNRSLKRKATSDDSTSEEQKRCLIENPVNSQGALKEDNKNFDALAYEMEKEKKVSEAELQESTTHLRSEIKKLQLEINQLKNTLANTEKNCIEHERRAKNMYGICQEKDKQIADIMKENNILKEELSEIKKQWTQYFKDDKKFEGLPNEMEKEEKELPTEPPGFAIFQISEKEELQLEINQLENTLKHPEKNCNKDRTKVMQQLCQKYDNLIAGFVLRNNSLKNTLSNVIEGCTKYLKDKKHFDLMAYRFENEENELEALLQESAILLRFKIDNLQNEGENSIDEFNVLKSKLLKNNRIKKKLHLQMNQLKNTLENSENNNMTVESRAKELYQECQEKDKRIAEIMQKNNILKKGLSNIKKLCIQNFKDDKKFEVSAYEMRKKEEELKVKLLESVTLLSSEIENHRSNESLMFNKCLDIAKYDCLDDKEIRRKLQLQMTKLRNTIQNAEKHCIADNITAEDLYQGCEENLDKITDIIIIHNALTMKFSNVIESCTEYLKDKNIFEALVCEMEKKKKDLAVKLQESITFLQSEINKLQKKGKVSKGELDIFNSKLLENNRIKEKLHLQMNKLKRDLRKRESNCTEDRSKAKEMLQECEEKEKRIDEIAQKNNNLRKEILKIYTKWTHNFKDDKNFKVLPGEIEKEKKELDAALQESATLIRTEIDQLLCEIDVLGDLDVYQFKNFLGEKAEMKFRIDELKNTLENAEKCCMEDKN